MRILAMSQLWKPAEPVVAPLSRSPTSSQMRSGLAGLFGNEILVIFPGAVRVVGVGMLVHIGAGVSQHAMIKFRVKPRHRERRRAAGTAAQRHAAIGILGQGHAVIFFNRRQNFRLDKFGVFAGHRVVFEAALAAAAVAAAVGDHHRDDRRQAMVGNHVVQSVGQLIVPRAVSIARHDDGSGRAGDILAGNIDRHLAGGRGSAQTGVGIKFAVGGVHREARDFALRHAILGRLLGGRGIHRAGGIIPVAGTGRPRREIVDLGDLGLVGLAQRAAAAASGTGGGVGCRGIGAGRGVL